MKSVLRLSALAAKLGLLVVALLMLVYPEAIFAAGGYAKCSNGSRVGCSGYRCVCTDNAGCTEYDQYGRIVRVISCPSGTEEGGGGDGGGDIAPILD
ncbi:MAG TPA: hypothetical protein VF588_02785 [Pyrinomonadaceae bacterium]|jgi:hypothetical protein